MSLYKTIFENTLKKRFKLRLALEQFDMSCILKRVVNWPKVLRTLANPNPNTV